MLSWVVGLASAGLFLAVALVIYIKVPPEQKDMTKGMNMSNLTKKKEPAPKPPTPAPAEAPAAPAETAPGSAAPEAPRP
jgi:hypothetical protein